MLYSLYYVQMTPLEDASPEFYNYFQLAEFFVQLKDGKSFGSITVDQITEETVNKYTQTPGGVCGLSLKPRTIEHLANSPQTGS